MTDALWIPYNWKWGVYIATSVNWSNEEKRHRKKYGDVMKIRQECDGPKFLPPGTMRNKTLKEHKTSKLKENHFP